MLLEIKNLGRRIVEGLRQVLGSLSPGPSEPVPVPVRLPPAPGPAPRGVAFWALLGVVLAVAGTTTLGHADDTVETPCAMCRAWDSSLGVVAEDQIHLEAHAVENGIVLQATATTLEVRTALWSMTAQRQQILDGLRLGVPVPLCPSCQANLQAFEELRIDSVRLHDGVLLLYTSTRPEIVRRLHEMLIGEGLLL